MSLRITAPVADYTGTVGGVAFVGGVATIEDPLTAAAALGYFRRRGYQIEEIAADAAPPVPTSPPAKNAAKPQWVAWAVLQGARPEDAEAMTVAELVATYGGAA